MRFPRSRIIKLLGGVVVCLLLAAAHPVWLRALGGLLVRAEAPIKADAVVVLAGDNYGHRILEGAELVRQGYAPVALVSGPSGFYGLHECDVAIPFAVKRGYAANLFVPLPHEALSTAEEAGFVARELRRRGARRYLLVTSNFHTARAARIFERQIPDIGMRVVAARDEWFDPERWWRSRQGWKIFAMEWQKTVAQYLGI